MRYVSVHCLRNGMKCGKAIVNEKSRLLLQEGVLLDDNIIAALKKTGLSGIYIADKYSKDIIVEDIISDTQRANSVRSVKNMFESIATGKAVTSSKVDSVTASVGDVVDAILAKESLNANLIDLKIFDDYTYYHSVNVGVLSIVVGKAMGLSKIDLRALGISAMLHDIGKVFISKALLNKPDKLTREEFEAMKEHSNKGCEYLSMQTDYDERIIEAVMDHHEKSDGGGYPHGKTKNEICTFGSIISIADVYDALTSDRPYRPAMPAQEAIEYIIGCSESSFTERVSYAFLHNVTPYAPGMMVRLSNGADAVVLSNNRNNCLRPIVRIVRENNEDVTPYRIDMMTDIKSLSLTIVSATPLDESTVRG